MWVVAAIHGFKLALTLRICSDLELTYKVRENKYILLLYLHFPSPIPFAVVLNDNVRLQSAYSYSLALSILFHALSVPLQPL